MRRDPPTQRVHWTISYETDTDPAAVRRDLSGLLHASTGALCAAAERD